MIRIEQVRRLGLVAVRPARWPRLLIAGIMLATAPSSNAQSGGPRPPSLGTPIDSTQAVPPFRALSPKAQLGKALFFDTTLSTPMGQSCASCHSPSAGFKFPNSSINQNFGVPSGAVHTRFGSRSVPQVSYAAFTSLYPLRFDPVVELYAGGLFWDGRALDLTDQAKFPFVDPNEMNNLTHDLGDPSLVVEKVSQGRFAAKFRSVYGMDIFSQPIPVVYNDIADAIAEYERSSEVSPFSSKYDAWRAGKAQLTDLELLGLRLATGTWTGRPDGGTYPKFAHCVSCHSIPAVPSAAPDVWTNMGFQNIGVPRNANNPFYQQTDSASNPVGYNPLGEDFVDYGLGTTMYTRLGLPPGNLGPGADGTGDFLGINGAFRTPSLRNVDRRPYPGFVKAYMHNGVFKSLEEVVHFYNTRNLTTEPGEVIDFEQEDPYANLRGQPLWPGPEYPSSETLVNPAGVLGTLPGTGIGGESEAEVGNLGLTAYEEQAIVAFLHTLSDGYFSPDDGTTCVAITSEPVSQRLCLGSSARVTVASNLPGAVRYQWNHDGVPIDGETLSFMWITADSLAVAGGYDCTVRSTCGSVTSRTAWVDVCVADINCDGAVDEEDLVTFMDEFQAGSPSVDLNGDGSVDVQDLVLFVQAFEQGC